MTPADRIRSDADELPRPDPVALAHSAAEAIAQLCATLDACALEVDARGGQRTARDHLLPLAKAEASRTLDRLAAALNSRPRPYPQEVLDIMAGVVGGYARPTWALRVVAIATEANR